MGKSKRKVSAAAPEIAPEAQADSNVNYVSKAELQANLVQFLGLVNESTSDLVNMLSNTLSNTLSKTLSETLASKLNTIANEMSVSIESVRDSVKDLCTKVHYLQSRIEKLENEKSKSVCKCVCIPKPTACNPRSIPTVVSHNVSEEDDNVNSKSNECNSSSKISEPLTSKPRSMQDPDRANNIVIHGLRYVNNNYQDVSHVHDLLKQKLSFVGNVLNVYPLGKPTPDKPVPYLVQLNCLNDKARIFRNCHSLAGSNISVCDDMSPEQKLRRKQLIPKLKELKRDGIKASLRSDCLYVNNKLYNA
jgi:hypothetical protein